MRQFWNTEDFVCARCEEAWRDALSPNCVPCNEAIRAGEDMADGDDG